MAVEPKASCYGIRFAVTSGKTAGSRQQAAKKAKNNMGSGSASKSGSKKENDNEQKHVPADRNEASLHSSRFHRICIRWYSVLRKPEYGQEVLASTRTAPIRDMDISQKAAPIIYDSSRPRSAIVEEAVELFRYRDLLWSLVHRDLTIRYKRSTLGFLWTMLNPLLMMLVLTIVFSNLFRFQIQHYPVYLLSGTLLYGFFQWGTSQSIHSIIWGGDLMGKIYLPKTIFVAAAVLVSLVNLLLALIPLAVIMIVNRCTFSFALLFLPVAIALVFVFALGIGLFVASLAVFFADIADIYNVALTILTYLTPIFYPIGVVPDKYRAFIFYNPMYYFVEIFRQPIHGGVFPDGALILRAFLISIGAFALGWWFFTKKSDEFAYRV